MAICSFRTLAVFMSMTFASPAFADLATDMWIMADAHCTKTKGKGCCGVADDEGYPASSGGQIACHCGALAKPTLADRVRLGKDRANIKTIDIDADTAKALSAAKEQLKSSGLSKGDQKSK